MNYHLSKFVDYSYSEAIERATAELKKEGFGILTQIDAKATLKEKIGADFRPYMILGACNPNFAHQALLAEDKVGTLMPCNVVVQQHDDGRVEVSAMNPAIMGEVIGGEKMGKLATEVAAMIRRVMAAL